MITLILASTSPYRKALLQQAGLEFKAISPLCNEDQLKDPALNATALTAKLAQHKAESLKNSYPDAFIIGSDQVLDFNGKIFGKSHNRENAIQQIKTLNGNEHTLVTSVYICGPNNKAFVHTDIAYLKMRMLSESEIVEYIDSEKPFDCAGSYKIEQKGIALFESITSQDYHSIQGLPLIATLSALKSWGYPILNAAQKYIINSQIKTDLFERAKKAQQNSYAPYSTKHIASSILWSDGSISSGCNIENASYGATVCAERTAIWNGLSQETQNQAADCVTKNNSKNRYHRKSIKAVVVLSEASPPWPPCGMCRQVISEFASEDLIVYLVNLQNEWLEYSWKEVFPLSFTPTHLL